MKRDLLDEAIQHAMSGRQVRILEIPKIRPEALRLIAENVSVVTAADQAVRKFMVKP